MAIFRPSTHQVNIPLYKGFKVKLLCLNFPFFHAFNWQFWNVSISARFKKIKISVHLKVDIILVYKIWEVIFFSYMRKYFI